ncbi:MAG: class I SAM-dependent methyltransferase [bacterium]|nr:class I SAM-dependent methyltransferase [bacterium]
MKQFYRNHKDNILIGWFLRLGRFVYRLPYVQKQIRQRRTLNEARYVLDQIYKDIPIGPYIKEFKNKGLLQKKFSLGTAGDFDILMLYLLTRIKKPQIVVETGVASGRSSSAILEALDENGGGNLFSVDLPKFYEGQPEMYLTEDGRKEHCGFVPKGKEPGWLVPDKLRKRWSLILGDSKTELLKLAIRLKRVDIFYHDSDHSYDAMMSEFQTIWPFIPPGGILLSDDVKGNNAFQDFVKKIKPKFHHDYDGLGIISK